jgi:hypothetical protein
MSEQQTHDYYRHGTTILFIALNVVGGKVIGECTSNLKADDHVSLLKLRGRKPP